ncbi:MAG: DapH/DapD/GlmU-related protein [Armatimonadota bacterium]
MARLQPMEQHGRTQSPWPLATHLRMFLWGIVWLLLFRPSPRPLHAWRRLLLHLFGCRIIGKPFVQPSVIIKMPWQLTLEDGACLGDRSEVYNLGPVVLKARSTVAQMAYLCGGTHDLSQPDVPLLVGEIIVGEEAFIGARALVLPGVTIGDGAVIGAGAVVAKDMPAWMVCVGNPCRPIKPRIFHADRREG